MTALWTTFRSKIGFEVPILLLSLLTTFFVWNNMRNTLFALRQREFSKDAEYIHNVTEHFFDQYLQTITAIDRFVFLQHALSERTFHEYVVPYFSHATLPIDEIRFYERIDVDDRSTEVTESHFAIRYVESKDHPDVVPDIGMVVSQSDLGIAFSRALNTNQTIVTTTRNMSPILGKPQQMLFIRAVYQTDLGDVGLRSMDRRLLGFVAMSVSEPELIAQYGAYTNTQDGIGFTLTGNDGIHNDQLLHHDEEETQTTLFDVWQQISPMRQPLQLHVWATQKYFLSSTQEQIPLVVLLIGVLTSFLLFGIAYALSSVTKRASILADSMTRSLRQEVEVRKHAEVALKKQSDEVSRMNRLMVGRELRMVELKEKIVQLQKKNHEGERS